MTRTGLRARLAGLREELRSQLWPLPATGVVLGLLGGILLPRLDGHLDPHLSARAASYLFGGGTSAARTLLGAIATSLITVTSLTFSLTVVTLQLASSQFSPRLLRTFTRDRLVHLTLALFLGTFTYALAVLRTVRDAHGDRAHFVPQLSVTIAFVLSLFSILGLVGFLAHLARQIRIETMLGNVHDDARRTFEAVLGRREPGATTPDVPAPGPSPAPPATLLAARSGFLLRIDEAALLKAAVAADAVLRIDRWPGCSLIAATPVGVAWSRSGAVDAPDRTALAARLGAPVGEALATGPERTPVQDIGYGLRQLVDVVNKALSPGINDPTSAVHALGHISALLCELTGRELAPRRLCDGEGQTRVILARPGFADLLELAVEQPRRYGVADPVVAGRLLELLFEVAWCVPDEPGRRAVLGQLGRLEADIAEQGYAREECDRLAAIARRVRSAECDRSVGSADPAGRPAG